MSPLDYDFPLPTPLPVFVRSSSDANAGPAATPVFARPRTAGLGGLLTAITR